MTTTTSTSATCEALVIHAPKDLRLEHVPIPALGDTQLLLKVKAGGICGSDLHYYQHGGFGTVRVKEPMVLGHEVAGQIAAVGKAVKDFENGKFSVGDRVAVSPSRPCFSCQYCRRAMQTHCLNMRYYGSAMPTPHIQGAFRQQLVVDLHQVHKLEAHVTDQEGSMAEPLSVVLHAVRRAGSLFGKRVLVTGCGPIGALIVLAAKSAGAIEVVATDMAAMPLKSAITMGADRAVNIATENLDQYKANKGHFDVLFEASGNVKALVGAFDVLKPQSILVQVGVGGEMSIPMNVVTAKEFELRGAFRFHEEYAQAVAMLNNRQVDVTPLITATISHRDADRAFALAADRAQAMKVIFSFE